MRKVMLTIRIFTINNLVWLLFFCMLAFLIASCNGNSNGDDDISVDDDYYPDDDYVPDDDMISDDDSGDDDTSDGDNTDDDSSDDDISDDDTTDDDSGDDDTTDDDINYKAGDIIIGTDLGNHGLIYVYSDEGGDNISINYNKKIKNSNNKATYDSTSITSIPSLSKGFDIFDLGWHRNSVRVAGDSSGNLHFIYFDEPQYKADHALHYVTNASGEWEDNIIMANQSWIEFPTLSIDINKNAHLCYFDEETNEIKYATNSSGTWGVEQVINNGYMTSLAVDSQGHAHITYTDFLNIFLFYTTNKTGNWKTQLAQIAPPSPYPDYPLSFLSVPSIVIDSNDNPIICDINNFCIYIQLVGLICLSETNFYCGYHNLGFWNMESVISEPDLTGWPSFIIDKNDKLHIIYNNGNQLIHATNETGIFETEIISVIGETGWISSVVDQKDNIHIAFINYPTYSIGYATNSSGEWVTTILEPIGI